MRSGSTAIYEFGPFRLDTSERQLFREGQLVALTEKVFELLVLLVQNHGHALSKLELMDRLWPDSVVEENNLTVNMSALRKALGETAGDRRYVETLSRRGYRFVAPVTEVSVNSARGARTEPSETDRSAAALEAVAARGFVGRDAELARLLQRWEEARAGQGRLVFVTGAAGMGKTELCRQMLARAARDERVETTTGRCLEHYGDAVAYLPFLDGLGGLLAGPRGQAAAQVLMRHAPSWGAQFPAAREAGAKPASPEQVHAGSLLREFAGALQVISTERPLVWLLEDLHWADPSSCDLLAYLAQRVRGFRVLIVATFRDDQAELSNHPLRNLKRELLAHSLCEELPLPLLDASSVRRYLSERFDESTFPPELGDLITLTTEGQPLFATRLVEMLVDQGDIQRVEDQWILARPVADLRLGVPDTVRGLIERKFDSLQEADRHALRYASVTGVDFSAAILADLLEMDEVALEERLYALARAHRLLDLVGEERLPDGRLTVRYRFAHVLYRNVLYDGIASRRRGAIHGRVAELLLERHPTNAGGLAAHVALHFERAGELERAIEHWVNAGDEASRLHADRESAHHFTHALGLVAALEPDKRVAPAIILHYNLGWCFSKAERYDEGLAQFLAMLAEASSPAFTGGSATADRARERAFDYFEQVWRDLSGVFEMPRMSNQPRSLGPSAIQCEAYWGICYTLLNASRLDELATWTQEYLRVADMHGNQPRRVEALGWMAALEVQRSNLREGIRLAEESIRLGRAIHHQRALFVAAHERARAHYRLAEYEAAEELLEQALAFTFEAQGRIATMLELARARVHRGEVAAGYALVAEAAEIASRTERDSWLEDALFAAGELHLELFDAGRAIEAFTRAVMLAARSGSVREEARARLWIASAHAQLGETEAAERSFDAAGRLLRETSEEASGGARRTAAPRMEYGLARGDLEGAERLARTWLSEAAAGQAVRGMALAHEALARVHLARGDRAAAASEAREALAVLGERSIPLVRVRALTTLAAAVDSRSKAPSRRALLEEARAIVERISEKLPDRAAREAWLASPVARAIDAGLSA